MHLLIVFIGVLGGLAAWGFLGLFMGPLVICLFAFLLESYRIMWKAYLEGKTKNTGCRPDKTNPLREGKD